MRTFLLSLSLLLLLAGTAFASGRLLIPNPQPGFSVSTRAVYYRITGRTAAQLRVQMSRRGPVDPVSGKRYDAYANWDYSWWLHDRASAGKCRVTGAEVKLWLKYTYPRWQKPQAVSGALVARWNSYLAALLTHEQGHGAIALRAGRSLSAGLLALDPQASCRKLETAGGLLAAKRYERLNKAEAAYDARTSHGASQGARFP